MATINWGVNADGDYGTASNWDADPERVPNTSDDAAIDTASHRIVTHGSGAHTVHSLTVGNDTFAQTGGTLTITAGASFTDLSVSGAVLDLGSSDATVGSLTMSGDLASGDPSRGGTVKGTGTVTVTGTATFNGGLMSGAGTTVLQGTTLVPPTTHLAEAPLYLDGGRVLDNQGTFTWTGNSISLGDTSYGAAVGGATLKNEAGATFDIETDSGASKGLGGQKGTNAFVNAGLVEKTAGTGVMRIGVAFTNTGTVNVQSGTLEFDGGGSSSLSAFTIASGATLGFGGATGTSAPTFTLGGSGTLAGTVAVSGGILDFGSSSVTLTDGFAQTSGTVTGTGNVTLAGGLTAEGGVMTGAGTTVLQGASTIDFLSLDAGRVLDNQGTVGWQYLEIGYNPYVYPSVGGGKVKNEAGAIFDNRADGSINFSYRFGGSFENAGLFEKTGGTGTTAIYTNFSNANTGTISIQTGTLEFDGGGSFSPASVTVASGATLGFGGDFSLGAGTVGGAVKVSGGTLDLGSANVTVSGVFTQTYANDDYSAVSGIGVLTLAGGARIFSFSSFGGALMQGSGTTVLQNSSTIEPNKRGATLSLDGGRILDNQGSLTVRGDIALGTSSFGTTVGGGAIVNEAGATFTLAASVLNGSGATSFTNAGALATSGAIGVSFSNTGTISIGAGAAGFFNGGGSADADAFTFGSSTSTFGIGGGTFELGAGTLNGNATVLGPGVLSIGSGDVTVTGRLAMNKGTISGDGTLKLAGGADFLGQTNGFAGSGTVVLQGVSTIAQGATISGGWKLENQGTLEATGAFAAKLAGTATLSGTVEGLLELDGVATLSGLTVGTYVLVMQGGSSSKFAALDVQNVVHQTGPVTLGDANGKAILRVEAGATYDIDNDSSILAGPVAGSSFVNAGTLAKTGGTGVSHIGVSLTSTGPIDVATGTLQLDGTYNQISGSLSGPGTLGFGTGTTITRDLDLTGGVSLTNAGYVSQYKPISIVNGTITNSVGGTWALNRIALAAGGTGLFTNAGTLNAGNTTIAVDFSDTGLVTVYSGTLTLAGATNAIAGTIAGAGTASFGGGGTFALNDGARATVANWTILGAGTAATLGTTLNYAGNFKLQAGTIFTLGGVLTLSGTAALAGRIDGTSRLVTSGATTISGATFAGTAAWQNTGTVTTASTLFMGDAQNFRATFTNAAGGIYNLTGNGGIALGGGTAPLFSNAGLLEKTGGTLSRIAVRVNSTGTIRSTSGTLEFDGASSTFAGTIDGTGTVAFGSTAATLAAGTTLSVARLSVINSGSRLVLGTSLSYGGAFTLASGTTLAMQSYNLTLQGAGSFAGAVSGTGTLTFNGASVTLNGAKLVQSGLSFVGGASVTLGSDLSTAATLTEIASSIALGGRALSLTGDASFTGGTVRGPGTLALGGATAVSGLTVTGSATLDNFGTLTQSGDIVLGDKSGGSATILNEAGARLLLTTDNAIRVASGGSGKLTNNGLLEKTAGSGTSTIAVALANAGTIEVASGTLNVTGALTNLANGALTGGTYRVDAGATLQFAGSPIATLAAAVELSGAVSRLQARSSTVASLESSLTAIATTGVLTVSGGRGYTGPNAIALYGQLRLGGGTFSTGAVTARNASSLSGFGTVASDLVTSGVVSASQDPGSAAATLRFTGHDSFTGTIGGAGTVEFGGGTDALGTGLRLTSAGLTLSGAAITLGANESYSGMFTLSGGSLDLRGHTWSLAGSAAFNGGTVMDGGIVGLHGTTTISGAATVAGRSQLSNYTALTQTGILALNGGAVVSSGTWTLAGDGSVRVAPAAAGTFTNLGTLAKTGAGLSTIEADLYNKASVSVSAGTLDVTGVVRGTGTFAIDNNATLEFGAAVAATERVSFGASGDGILLLDDARTFGGTVAGLVAGDTIDLAGFDPAATTLSYTANAGNSGGVLDVRSGASRAAIALDGQFLASAFHSAADGQGGTSVSYGTGQQALPQLAVAHA